MPCCCTSTRFGGFLVLATSAIAALGVMMLEPPAEKKDAPKPGAKPSEAAAAADDRYVLGFKMKSIDDKDVDLAAQFKGKVVMVVNVASRCGFTGQYEGLEKLYQERKDKGLVILGFPANNFGGQEPGSNEEIAKFCQSKYNVTFPMFAKISVKGDDQHPLYKKIAAQPAPVGGEPKWNFTKFLVDRAGNVVARFDSSVRPNDKDMLAKIDELLAAK
ncbi:MAG: glutathione peroxidase [Phycisphaerales bacterium]